MIAIRNAQPADVPQILGFVRELADHEGAPDKVVATEELLHQAMFGEDRPSIEAVIAEIDGAPAGMALFFHNYSTWTGWRGLYLEDLYVTPGARGAGVGTALLKHLAGIAVDRDCSRFEWAVMDDNINAQKFYRAMGAHSMDDSRVNRVTGEALRTLAGR